MFKKILAVTAPLLTIFSPAASAADVAADGAFIPTWVWLVMVAELIVIIVLVSYITIKNNEDR